MSWSFETKDPTFEGVSGFFAKLNKLNFVKKQNQAQILTGNVVKTEREGVFGSDSSKLNSLLAICMLPGMRSSQWYGSSSVIAVPLSDEGTPGMA